VAEAAAEAVMTAAAVHKGSL